MNHGFLRARDGTFTTLDVPEAGTSSGQGTVASCDNPSDAVSGHYYDANNVAHGFLRIP